MAVSTLTPEFGPPSYQHTLPPDGTPIGDLAEICDWQAAQAGATLRRSATEHQLDDIRRTPALHEPGIPPHFGGAPAVWARAPGRVDLMGSHTDYNLGYVMTMTIDRDTWIAARPRARSAGGDLLAQRATAAANSISMRSSTMPRRPGPTTCAGSPSLWRRPATP